MKIAMDVAGLGFAMVVEARNVAQRIVCRVVNYGPGRREFKELIDSLAHLTRNIEEVVSLTGEFAITLPQDVADLFVRTMDRVCDGVSDAESTLEMELS